MKTSYKKLWKLIIDRDMTNTPLGEAEKISSSSLAKLGKDENVTTSVLAKICGVLNCDVSDIMEMIPDETTESEDKVNG